MCGLYGVIGQGISSIDQKIFMELGLVNMLRGVDASGIVFGNSRQVVGENIRMRKSPEDFLALKYKMIDDQKSMKLFENLGNNFYLGHNRHATVGTLSKDNTHPFLGKKNIIVGMHNGTIKSNYIMQEVDDKDDKKWGTDSECLINDIEAKTQQKDNKFETFACLNDDDDAFAVVWYDIKKKKVYITRNKRRGLFFAVNTVRRVMYYSSEKEALELVLNRNSAEYQILVPGARQLFEINPSSLSKDIRPWSSFTLPPEAPRDTIITPNRNIPAVNYRNVPNYTH